MAFLVLLFLLTPRVDGQARDRTNSSECNFIIIIIIIIIILIIIIIIIIIINVWVYPYPVVAGVTTLYFFYPELPPIWLQNIYICSFAEKKAILTPLDVLNRINHQWVIQSSDLNWKVTSRTHHENFLLIFFQTWSCFPSSLTILTEKTPFYTWWQCGTPRWCSTCYLSRLALATTISRDFWRWCSALGG